MMSRFVPLALLVVLAIGYLGFLFGSAPQLPERVASHFGWSGEPNGWMGRSGYLTFMALMGIGMSLFIVAICFLSKFFPAWMVNMPRRDYWLAPERRGVAQASLSELSWWLACLMFGFFGALHYLVLRANRSIPLRMPSELFLSFLALFLVGLGIWMFFLYRRFGDAD